nr:Holliday junction branch migration DNA helicase RuvB [Planobispora longispora]
MNVERDLVSAEAAGDERLIEAALRPKRLDEFIGQARVREQLSLVLHSALRRNRPPDHVLMSGSPGLGKTTLSMIIATELGVPLRITSGPALERAATSPRSSRRCRRGGPVHRRDPPDGPSRRGDALPGDGGLPGRHRGGQGPGATAIPLEIAPFTLVGATTRAGLLRRRCATGSASSRTWTSTRPPSWSGCCTAPRGCWAWSSRRTRRARSPGGPGHARIANRLLRRVRDFAEVRADGVITREIASAALNLYEVDAQGLDRLDRAVLGALLRRFGGGPVGLSTLAVAVGEEPETVEVVAEPFLVRQGLLARTPAAGSRPRPPGSTWG